MKKQNTHRAFTSRIVLMTLGSIANSVFVTCLLTWATLGWPSETYYSSYAIWRCAVISGFTVPALIGPFVIWRLVKIVDELQAARETLARLATTDELTGLLNRRGFDARAERAITEARSTCRPISALVCDIDRFKSINDRFGHHAGDLVIRRVGELLREGFASTEALLCRHGGEEFVVILPGLSLAQASNWADRFRAACAAEALSSGAQPIMFTISIGVAEISPSVANLSELLGSADAALYEAKQGGRNQVATYPSSRLRLVANG